MHLELDNVVPVPRYILLPSTLHVLLPFLHPTSSASSVTTRDIPNLCFDSALLVRPHASTHDGRGAVTSGFDL